MVGQRDKPASKIDGWKHTLSVSKASQSEGRTQSQSVGQVSETDGDEEIKVGVLDGAGVQMAMETDPRPS